MAACNLEELLDRLILDEGDTGSVATSADS